MQLTILILFTITTFFPAVGQSQMLNAAEVEKPAVSQTSHKSAHELNIEYLSLFSQRDVLANEMILLQNQIKNLQPDAALKIKYSRLTEIDAEMGRIKERIHELAEELQTTREYERKHFGALKSEMPPVNLQSIDLFVRLVDKNNRLTIGRVQGWDLGHPEMMVSVLEINPDGTRSWVMRPVDYTKLQPALARILGQGHNGFVVGQAIRIRYGTKGRTFPAKIEAIFQDNDVVINTGVDKITGIQNYGLVAHGRYMAPSFGRRLFEMCAPLLLGLP